MKDTMYSMFATPFYLLVVFACANGQTIETSISTPNVKIGEQLNYTLGTFNPGVGNSLTTVIAGYLLPGSCDLHPLAYWNITSSSLMVYDRLAQESPSYAGRITILSSHTMTINNISITDQGRVLVFRLIYTNPLIMMLTSNQSVVVVTDLTPPQLNTTSVLSTVEGDTGVKVVCTSTGTPTPMVYWKKGGQALPSYATVTYPPTSADKNISVLSFQTLNRQFRGVYTCMAENFAHMEAKKFTLSVKSGPENVAFNYTCSESSSSLCWTSPDDTVDSLPDIYTIKISTGAQQAFPASTLCLNASMYSNTTSNHLTVSVEASNQYGSSGMKSINIRTACPSGASHLATQLSFFVLTIFIMVLHHFST